MKKTITQSLIKDMIGEYCNYYLKLKYIDNIETEPTKAMMDGLAFETKLIGSSRGGAFEYPKLKNGGISKAEKEIDEVVILAKKVLKNLNIKIVDVQVTKTKDDRSGTIDAIIEVNKKRAIADVKYTGLSFAQYEKELTWSPLASNYKLQARQYQSLFDEYYQFIFLVFSAKGWARVFVVDNNKDEIDEHKNLATLKLKEFNNLDLEQPTTDSNICNICKLNNVCKKRNYTPKIEFLP